MIALSLRFPAGRYHATPWGRQVNEAAIAWPPEPLRLLRTLIATHHRKADDASFGAESLANLIDTLAEQLPLYRLPKAVHAHTRHYMPSPVKTTLVFDAFARFDPEEEMIVGWPGVALGRDQRAHLEHLAKRLGYIGRAESWVDAAVTDWPGQDANARPLEGTGEVRGSSESIRGSDDRNVTLYGPLSPDAYQKTREGLIREARERCRAGWRKKSKPTEKALDAEMKSFLVTLPERLVHALAVDTSDLQAVGWSDPPAARRVVYSAPDLVASWRGACRQRTPRKRPDPTVACFVLAGRPLPRIEDTVKIAEIMRLAAMAQFGWDTVEGKRCANAPSAISGYGEDGRPLRAEDHAHAFWLPEDADDDGQLDRVIVYSAAGLDDRSRQKLDRITRLWIDKRGRDDGGESTDSGRKEWRLALEGFGQPSDFASASPLLRCSSKWISTTPYLMPWHAKKRFGWADQIARELRDRGMPNTAHVPREFDSITINERHRRPIHFHRFRSRRGLQQPDRLGRFVELTFEDHVSGPLALGFGCHFGLGLFRPSSTAFTPSMETSAALARR